MGKLNEKSLIEIMRRLYQNRLNEVLSETYDIEDGTVSLSPGTKVKHKETGIVYTVDRVEDGNVFLNPPEVPRFEPTHGEEFVGEQAPVSPVKTRRMTPPSQNKPATQVIVSLADFDQQYKVT